MFPLNLKGIGHQIYGPTENMHAMNALWFEGGGVWKT